MKRYKKAIALFLTATTVLSMAGCKSKEKKVDSDDAKATETTKVPATATPEPTKETADPTAGPGTDEKDADFLLENPYGGLVKLDDADDPITFKVFIRDPKQAPASDNPVINKITELTGVTIEWEFLVGDLEQKEGVMIAGEDYPDAIFAGDHAPKFIDAGAFIPLEDKIPNYKLLPYIYDEKQEAKMTAPDGHKYILEIYGAQNNPSPVFRAPNAGFYIQKAVLEEAGYPIPRTLDEYFKLIEDYKAKHPQIDGVDTIGFEILTNDSWRDFCLRNPAQHLMGAGNDGDAYVDLNTMKSSYYQISDSAHNYYKKLNEEYHKGIIPAETLTENYDQYIARLTSGAVLGMFDQYWNFMSADNVLLVDGKPERSYIAVPITDPGVPDGYLDAKTGKITGNNGIGITKNCKDPDRLMKFYDYILQREVQDYLLWGEEGKDWNYDADGIDRTQTPERRALMRDEAKNRDLTGNVLWNFCPKRQGLYNDGTPCTPEDSASEFVAGLSEYDQKFLKAYGFKYPAEMLSDPIVRPDYFPLYAFPIEDGSPAKVANQKMNDIIRRYFPQLIVCDADKYESLWQEMLDEFANNDLQPYLDEIDRQIATYNK
ncbi:MAG: extracellular solute-binding protein [Clostridiales bacterium]|nr:extracellular solute-binding protein [Clostridiales bacterium]